MLLNRKRNENRPTQEWINIIDSGRAYSKLTIENHLFDFERLKNNHFIKVIKYHCSKGDQVLEAGCGEACNSFVLASNGINVTALDISETLISKLQQVRNYIDTKTAKCLEFVIGDIFKLNKLDKQFDLVAL